MKKLIIISNPDSFENEFSIINKLFDVGMECFHLRKPGMNLNDYEACLKQIAFQYHPKVIIHEHFSLAQYYPVGGLHFRDSYLQDVSIEELIELMHMVKERNMTISRSVHNPEDTISSSVRFNYYFLSPIFESISKPGYAGKFDNLLLSKFISDNPSQKLIALGGISNKNVIEALKMGFYGVAVLGDLWNKNIGNYQEYFKDLKKIIENYG